MKCRLCGDQVRQFREDRRGKVWQVITGISVTGVAMIRSALPSAASFAGRSSTKLMTSSRYSGRTVDNVEMIGAEDSVGLRFDLSGPLESGRGVCSDLVSPFKVFATVCSNSSMSIGFDK